ncbi:MAG: hypothetical protein GEU75_17165 [Dehalococcoidia bacterium]|nr:hypothetical protein [Dehalococcoidia bacterium]
MDTTLIISLIGIGIAIAIAVSLWIGSNKKRTAHLKDRYGDEYERTVTESDRRGEAEKELMAREERVKRLHIKELTDEQRDRFGDEWRLVQVRFVDDPGATIKDADTLVQKVMDARGYPITDFDQQAADISVDHPEVVSNYRAAHTIALEHERDGAGTESLRQAVIHYRALFSELLGRSAVAR